MSGGYGKLFESVFKGSMAGKGSHVFSVWMYSCINADARHRVYLNPRGLSVMIGDTVEKMKEAIEYFCQPDPDSTSKVSGGKRLIPIAGDNMVYYVVNHKYYRDKLSESNDAVLARERQRKHREDLKNRGKL